MKRTGPLVGLLFMFAGHLAANPIITCNLNGGGTPGGGCYTASSFAFNDLLDWGVGLGSAIMTASNPYNTTLGPLNTNTQNGVGVSVSLGPGFSGDTPPELARVDNTVWAWSGTEWVAPDTLVGGGQHVLTYGGQFGAPDSTTHPVYPSDGAFGDHLLSVYNGNGPLVLSFSQGLSAVGFRISTRSLGDFQATLKAYDGLTELGTYVVTATESGGICASLFTPGNPVPCNNAPFIGIGNTNWHITSIVVTANDGGGFFIDTMSGQEVPEPALGFLMGISLTAMILWGRRTAKSRQ